MMYEEQILENQDPLRMMMMKKKRNANEIQKKLRKTSSLKEKFATGKVVVMDLSGLSLESLPNPSLNLASVSKLDLSNNNLQNIPESLIARLLNVIVVDVHSNQLKSLPNSIGCLSKLKILNVSGNFLQSLPKTIENCKSLEELNANFNELSKLPDTIGFELTNLKKLSVNSNKLEFLPFSTSHLTSLRVLDARLNSLRSLPQDMENLTNLQVLNVSQNFRSLSTLPYSIGLLISLVELDVSYNNISVLPDSIGCLRNLQKLSVEGNPLVSPPMQLVEQGVQAVKEYLSEKMTEGYNGPTKKKSWAVVNFVKCGTPKPGKNRQGGGGGFFSLSDYRQIQGLLSPRHLAMLSPRRLFSPRRSRPSVG